MIDYERLEDEIVAKLEADSGFAAISDVEPLPDDINSYRISTQKGIVHVVFLSERYNANQSIGQVSQHSTIVLNLSIHARDRRGEKGVYAISKLVKDILVGYSPSDCGKMNLSEQDFLGNQNDVWEYGLTFSCTSLRSQLYPESMPVGASELELEEEVFYNKNNVHENIHV